MTAVEPVIAISDLTRRFGGRAALSSVTLTIPRGGVYGLVGANGAGKTTLIRHVLGLLRAEEGSVRVFGRDPVADPVGVLSRIGYLSEENDLPGWMRVDELMRYARAFYPGWDDAYAAELRAMFALDPAARIKTLSKGQKARAGLVVALAYRPELLVLDEPSSGLDPIVRRDILGAVLRTMFALDPAAKVKTLSKGQKARAGLVVALAYRPELLVLDEPSSGLDPIVRRDILGAVLRTIGEEGRTVLFSSHLLEEVEQVADHVTMIRDGKIVVSAPLQEVKDAHGGASLDEIFVERIGGG